MEVPLAVKYQPVQAENGDDQSPAVTFSAKTESQESHEIKTLQFRRNNVDNDVQIALVALFQWPLVDTITIDPLTPSSHHAITHTTLGRSRVASKNEIQNEL